MGGSTDDGGELVERGPSRNVSMGSKRDETNEFCWFKEVLHPRLNLRAEVRQGGARIAPFQDETR